MSMTFSVETQVEERADHWVVTCAVNGEPGSREWGPFATRGEATVAANAVLQDLVKDVERIKAGLVQHIHGMKQ